MCRYSVTVKQMDLKNASSPAQRKRLLSLAAADCESGRMSRSDAGESDMQQLDSDSEADHILTAKTRLDSVADQTLITETEENGTLIIKYAYIHIISSLCHLHIHLTIHKQSYV